MTPSRFEERRPYRERRPFDVVGLARTDSTDFPTVSPLQAVFGGEGDAFVAKIGSETIP